VEDVLEAMKVSRRQAVNEFFEDQNREFYFEGLNKLKHRREKCIDVEGNYYIEK
jgi:hypothetical protein